MNHLLQITTPRLELIPCSLEVAQSVVAQNKLEVENLLGVRVPDDWYAGEVLDFFPAYAQMLAEDASQLGWGVWLMIHNEDYTLIGDLGFGIRDWPTVGNVA